MVSIDRLSCLPDELICHILAFLPTEYSVRTGVLSKRWKFLWAHVPSLKFDFDEPFNSEIINNILLQHKCEIHRLKLHGNFEGTQKELESWIVNIPNLDISLGEEFDLPQCLFTCKTVVDLRLHCFGYIPENGIYLPALKKLNLGCFYYQSSESLAHLLSGCPVLEEFSFEDLVEGHFCVSSSILKRLVINLEENHISKFGLKLDTPALRYLQLSCKLPDNFSVGALDSLIEADISLYWDEVDQDNLLYSRNVLALVGKLHNVRLLRLFASGSAMMNHVSAFFALGIKFHNLTKLDLSATLGFFTCFLENANNLQVLRLVIYLDNQYDWVEPKRVPACLLSHLQTVNVRSFRCLEQEFDVIRYILRNAKVLKRMEVRTSKFCNSKEKHVALKRLASFGRGSQECELRVISKTTALIRECLVL